MKMPIRAAFALLAAAACLTPALAQRDSFPDDSLTASCRHWSVITPSDSAVLARLPKAIWVATAGDVKMIGKDAPDGAAGVIFPAVPAWTLLPVRPRQVLATGTTSGIVLIGCY